MSHAAVVASNQGVWAALARRGHDVTIVMPARWSNEYARDVDEHVAPELAGRVVRLPVLGRGRPQRHAYVASASRVLARTRPDVVVVEEEPFSVAARQWIGPCTRRGVPCFVQLAETIDRQLPALAARSSRRVLREASGVLARSATAARLAAAWGARGRIEVVPHSVAPAAARPVPPGPPVALFVGRLVEAKGLADLLAAIERLGGAVSLLVAGDGPLRDAAARAEHVRFLGPVPHDEVGALYAQAHVTCVPSRTTPTWAEQFGRVVLESLVRGVPVLASDSGELPWLLGATDGGVIVPEGDVTALAEALGRLGADGAMAAALGARGREGVLARFTDDAVAEQLEGLVVGELRGRAA